MQSISFQRAVRELCAVSGDLKAALSAFLTGDATAKQFQLRAKRAIAEWQTEVLSAIVSSSKEKDSYITAWEDVVRYGTSTAQAAEVWGVDEDTLTLMVLCANYAREEVVNKKLRSLRENSVVSSGG